MEVKVVLAPHFTSPVAEIRANAMTEKIEKVVDFIKSDQPDQKIHLQLTNKELIVLEKKAIVVVRTEAGKVVVYGEDGRWYETKQTLTELEQSLGDDFVRISKSSIVNIDAVCSVKASFSGTLELLLKNDLEEVISRNYRKAFKLKLGV